MCSFVRRLRLLIATSVVVAGCGSSSKPPTQPVDPVNNAPVVSTVVPSLDRIEAGNELDVTATVTDTETPVAQLTYAWAAVPAGGTFTGTGPQVRWRAPSGASTPGKYRFTVTVSEQYTSRGQVQTHVVSATSAAEVHYNDMTGEIVGLARQFYEDFGAYTVSAAQCVRNFSDRCAGKAAELSDIAANRARTDFRIVGSTLLDTPVVTRLVGNLRYDARFVQRCRFEDVEVRTGRRFHVEDICYLYAVYEDLRWRLCDSRFGGIPPALNPMTQVPDDVRRRNWPMTPGAREWRP